MQTLRLMQVALLLLKINIPGAGRGCTACCACAENARGWPRGRPCPVANGQLERVVFHDLKAVI